MPCNVSTMIAAIVEAYRTKVSECECDNSFLPSNLADLCGDGEGLLKEIIDGTDSLIADCELTESKAYPRPSLEDCGLDNTFLQALLDWISHLLCEPDGCLETISHSDLHTIDARLKPSISAFYPQQIWAGAVVGGSNYTVVWYEGATLFNKGKYVLTLETKNSFSIQLRRYTDNVLLFSRGSATISKPCYTIVITDSMRAAEKTFGNITSVKVETVLVVEDCDGNRVVTSIHDSRVDSACGDNALAFELFGPSKIGMATRFTITTTGETPNTYIRLAFTNWGGEYSLSPCPNECFPEKVINLAYSYVGGSTASLSWTDQGCCRGSHKIYWEKIDRCSDCSTTTTLTYRDETTSGSPYSMPALAVGLYCIRVDTVRGSNTAYGTPICVNITCVPVNDVVLDSSTPANGSTLGRISGLSSTSFSVSVTATYVSKMKLDIRAFGGGVSSTLTDVVFSGLNPAIQSTVNTSCTVTSAGQTIYKTYLFTITLYDECDNAYQQEDVVFSITGVSPAPQWYALTKCQFAQDPFGSTYCASLSSYPSYFSLRWVTNTGADVTERRGDLYCAIAPGSGAYCVQLQGLR